MSDMKIDWAALQHTSGDVPWDAMQGAVEAVVAEPVLLDEIFARYRDITADSYVIATFEYYYLPYIVTKAAGKLSAVDAGRAHKWLIEELVAAGDMDDEGMLEFLMFCGLVIGPAILPSVQAIFADPLFDATSGAWFSVWGVADVVKESEDEETRKAFADLAMRTLKDAVKTKGGEGDANFAAHMVASLKHVPAIPLLTELASRRTGAGTFVWREFDESLKILRGEVADYPVSRRDLEEEVRTGKRLLEKWYGERPKDWNDWSEEDLAAEGEFEDLEEYFGDPVALEPSRFPLSMTDETIRNSDKKIGRNDPCPCGSGKKYKKCCGG